VLGHDLAGEVRRPSPNEACRSNAPDEMGLDLQRAFKIANEAPPGRVGSVPIQTSMEQETKCQPASPRKLFRRGRLMSFRRLLCVCCAMFERWPGADCCTKTWPSWGRRGRARRCRQDPGKAGERIGGLGCVAEGIRGRIPSDRPPSLGAHDAFDAPVCSPDSFFCLLLDNDLVTDGGGTFSGKVWYALGRRPQRDAGAAAPNGPVASALQTRRRCGLVAMSIRLSRRCGRTTRAQRRGARARQGKFGRRKQADDA